MKRGVIPVTIILALGAAGVLANTAQTPPKPTIKHEAVQRIESVDGKQLFSEHCAVCHGADAKGNGPAAVALKAPPPDLTTIGKRHGKFSAKDVEDQITGTGKAMADAHGTREMPMWGPAFRGANQNPDVTKLAIANLVKYVESIQVK